MLDSACTKVNNQVAFLQGVQYSCVVVRYIYIYTYYIVVSSFFGPFADMVGP